MKFKFGYKLYDIKMVCILPCYIFDSKLSGDNCNYESIYTAPIRASNKLILQLFGPLDDFCQGRASSF